MDEKIVEIILNPLDQVFITFRVAEITYVVLHDFKVITLDHYNDLQCANKPIDDAIEKPFRLCLSNSMKTISDTLTYKRAQEMMNCLEDVDKNNDEYRSGKYCIIKK